MMFARKRIVGAALAAVVVTMLVTVNVAMEQHHVTVSSLPTADVQHPEGKHEQDDSQRDLRKKRRGYDGYKHRGGYGGGYDGYKIRGGYGGGHGPKARERVKYPSPPGILVVNSYAQLSSTKTQTNAPLGEGSAIEVDSVDASSGIEFTPTTDFTIDQDGAYFALAAPQIGAVMVSDRQVADYWTKLNDENVSNSNVRYANPGLSQDVIITQGVYEFTAEDKFQVAGSGENSFTQVVNQAGEPLVPSIIFSIFQIEMPVYAQLSSTETQMNGPLGVGTAITFNSIDAISGITQGDDPSVIVIPETGAYFALAAPQVAAANPANGMQIADYWMKLNGENIGNSNVRFIGHGEDEDVIITQGVLNLSEGDNLQVFGSGINSVTQFIQEAGEPDVPSIIFSIFELAENTYAQLSSTETQPNGPLGSGAAISFNSIDALENIGFDPARPTEITVLQAGTYFVLAAPQIGGTDVTVANGMQVADYWVKLNGEDIGNSSVRYNNVADHKDVIITQGVLADLAEGDVLQVFGSGVNSNTEFIQEAGEPDVPSIIFSMFLI